MPTHSASGVPLKLTPSASLWAAGPVCQASRSRGAVQGSWWLPSNRALLQSLVLCPSSLGAHGLGSAVPAASQTLRGAPPLLSGTVDVGRTVTEHLLHPGGMQGPGRWNTATIGTGSLLTRSLPAGVRERRAVHRMRKKSAW